jgi:hypothetical protein
MTAPRKRPTAASLLAQLERQKKTAEGISLYGKPGQRVYTVAAVAACLKLPEKRVLAMQLPTPTHIVGGMARWQAPS